MYCFFIFYDIIIIGITENYEEILSSITPAEVRDAFRNLVNADNHLLLSIGDFEL